MNTQVLTFENQEFGKVRTVEISGNRGSLNLGHPRKPLGTQEDNDV